MKILTSAETFALKNQLQVIREQMAQIEERRHVPFARLLASLAIHAAVLLLIMPRVGPTKEDQAKAPVVTTMPIISDDQR